MSKLIDRYSQLSVALTEQVHAQACNHLLRDDGQEDLAFGLWYPSQGERRLTALVHELVLPKEGDRQVHGNVSFNPQFLTRALKRAMERGAGLLLMHSHLGPGWQGMSPDDIRAESNNAGAVLSATNLPFLGLTLATDGAWSARLWCRTAPHKYELSWCYSARVVGQRLLITDHPKLRTRPVRGDEQERTEGVWGREGHATINNLRIGVVGLGSVGSLVCEALARQGVREIVLIDFDRIQPKNLDRTAGATRRDIGRLKVHVAANHAHRCSTADHLMVNPVVSSVVESDGYRAALDCDLIFSCVDRPWGRQVLNHIAYAHLIPVVNGGILVRLRGERLVGADWHIHTVAPSRRCMECWKAFDPADVGLEMEGMLDEPSYIKQMDPNHPLLRHENVFPFSMNVAALEFQQMAAMIMSDVPNVGDQNGHFIGGRFDRTTDTGCDADCLFTSRMGTGDFLKCFVGEDRFANRDKTHCYSIAGYSRVLIDAYESRYGSEQSALRLECFGY